MTEYIYETQGEQVIGNLKGFILPKEEIVRCRDCKYRYGCLHLLDKGDDDMRRCHATPDGFCIWGERRTNDN